jgi:hypothetical protein
VKGSAAGSQVTEPFLDRNAPEINEARAFSVARYIPDRLKLFSLGRTVAILDNALT